MLKRVARKNCLSSVASLSTEFQSAFESNVSTRTVGPELHEMDVHGRAAAHKPKFTMHNAKFGWSGVKLISIGLWSSGNSFSGVMTHASPSGSPTDESGFDGCQENVWCRRNSGLGLFLMVRARPLSSSEGKS